MKRGGSLRRRSAKMVALYETARVLLVKRLLTERPFCEARLPGCTVASEDVHEIVSRARGGSLLDESNLAVLCRRCHDFITTHPHVAHVKGFSRHSWERKRIEPLP